MWGSHLGSGDCDVKTSHYFKICVLFQSLVSQHIFADWFDDQGNLLGVYRSDYNAQDKGSAANPLSFGTGCYYPQSEYGTQIFIEVHPSEACPTGPSEYFGGPFPLGDFTASSYWVVSGNVETYAYANEAPEAPLDDEQGAPSLSTNLAGDPPNLLQFYMTDAGNKWDSQILIDNEGQTGPKFDAIPFLSVGGHKNRGNSVNVGRMNNASAPHKTTFRSKLKMASPGPGGVLIHAVIAVAKWGGKNRMIQLILYHHGTEWSTEEDPGLHRHWNWSALHSFWYPGADIAFIEAEDIEDHCGPGVGNVPRITTINQFYTYEVDWEFLFRCLSDPGVGLFDDEMPATGGVPIFGVHWSAELTGDSSMWVTITRMKMKL